MSTPMSKEQHKAEVAECAAWVGPRSESPTSIEAWAVETFGQPSPQRIVTRVLQEVIELVDVLDSDLDDAAKAAKAREELADVVICCMRWPEAREFFESDPHREFDEGDRRFGVDCSCAADRAANLLEVLASLIRFSPALDGVDAPTALQQIHRVRLVCSRIVLISMALRDDPENTLWADVTAKMVVNRGRKWVRKGDGTGQHVKDAAPDAAVLADARAVAAAAVFQQHTYDFEQLPPGETSPFVEHRKNHIDDVRRALAAPAVAPKPPELKPAARIDFAGSGVVNGVYHDGRRIFDDEGYVVDAAAFADAFGRTPLSAGVAERAAVLDAAAHDFAVANYERALAEAAERLAEKKAELAAMERADVYHDGLATERMWERDAALARAQAAERELSEKKAALAQMTELHSNLTKELADQYSKAERAGWVSPTRAKRTDEEITALKAEIVDLKLKLASTSGDGLRASFEANVAELHRADEIVGDLRREIVGLQERVAHAEQARDNAVTQRDAATARAKEKTKRAGAEIARLKREGAEGAEALERERAIRALIDRAYNRLLTDVATLRERVDGEGAHGTGYIIDELDRLRGGTRSDP